MIITQAQLLRAVPETNKARINEFVAAWNMFSVPSGMTSPKRVVHALAQIYCESGALKATSENLNYSAQRLMQVWPSRFKSLAMAEQYAHNPQKLANLVYANRMGNGNEASGDGWRYRGRGFIGLTGRFNYSEFNRYDLCTDDVILNPDKVAEYPLNLVSALWFWETHKLNDIADLDDGGKIGESIVERITKKVNGGYNGLSERKFYYRRFKKEFGL
jgi:putative chitinase